LRGSVVVWLSGFIILAGVATAEGADR